MSRVASSARRALVPVLLAALALAPASAPAARPAPCTVVAEGDSLTYGQDTTSAQTRPPINGATQSRSVRPFPDYLGRLLGPGFRVLNHGFPGDRTTEGLTRWKAVPGVHVAILLFGTNDALNFGGYPDGPVSAGTYAVQLRRLVDRFQGAGAQVILIVPPPLGDAALDRQLDPYRAVVTRMARSRSLPIVALTRAETHWTDGVHLDPASYALLADKLLPLVRSCRAAR